MLSWEFPPLLVGGLGRHVAELAPALAAAGHEVRVLTRGTGTGARTEQVGAITVHRAAADGLDIDLGSESVLAWSQAFEHSLTRAGLDLLGDWQPELIHAHDWLVGQTAVTLSRFARLPLVVTMHASEHGRQQGWLSEPVPRAIHSIERWLCDQADQVIACSRYMAGQLARTLGVPAERLQVVGNGVRALPATSPTTRWPGDPLIAFAGRLVHEKGLQELIKALPRLRERFPDVRLVVAGTGSLLAEQRDRAGRYRVAELISWPGFLDGGALAGLFQAAQVVVVPSVYEPFGLVALEAQRAGTPVAVADTGGLRELVEPGVTGSRFASQNPAALAEAVAGLLSDPDSARRMATAAQQRAISRFSWPAVASRTGSVYQLARSGRRRPA